jgi:hypothetical protein
MKTVPFSDILSSVCQLIGLDKTTLSDRSFSAVRDMTSRRIGSIWDREEWPDAIRSINTWTGNPVSEAFSDLGLLLLENGNDLLTESGMTFYLASGDTFKLTLSLDQTFKRVYLIDFSANAYRLNTIGVNDTIKINNPFYILKEDGTRHSVGDSSYNYTYTTADGANGKYITSVSIDVPFGDIEYGTYQGPNSDFTAKVSFSSNPNLVIQLDTEVLHGLEAFSADPSITTRAKADSFVVEDFDYIDDTNSTGYVLQREYTYLRFLTESKKFIRYRQVAPRLFGFAWDGAKAYYGGSQAYFDPAQGSSSYNPILGTKNVRGDFWKCILLESESVPISQSPNYSSQYWEMVQIPYRFKDFLVNGVASDFLKSEGRAEEAAALDNLAEMAVQQQIDVLVRQQGQVQKMNMVYTY